MATLVRTNACTRCQGAMYLDHDRDGTAEWACLACGGRVDDQPSAAPRPRCPTCGCDGPNAVVGHDRTWWRAHTRLCGIKVGSIGSKGA